jgi:hypothetical protein
VFLSSSNYTSYANWGKLLPGTGAKYARLQGGWERCEPNGGGKYDWAWLDEAVLGITASGVAPWVETSYGNSNYPDGGTMEANSPLPKGDAALTGWTNWVTALTCRYSPAAAISPSACSGQPRLPGLIAGAGVTIWEIWNEPNHLGDVITPALYGSFVNLTGTAIRAVNPTARIWAGVLAGSDAGFASGFLKQVQTEGGLGLVESVTYHPYQYDPDEVYGEVAALQKAVAEFDGISIRQGENGAPSTEGQYGALGNYNWTQCSQAKWTTRRMLGDHGRGIWSSIFSIVDLCYSGTINTKGLIEANCPEMTIVGPKTAYASYASIASLLDDTWQLRPDVNVTITPDGGSWNGYTPEAFAYSRRGANSTLLVTAWLAGHTPTNAVDTPSITSTIRIEGDGLLADDMCWADTIDQGVWQVPTWSVSRGVYTVDSVPLSDYASIVMGC